MTPAERKAARARCEAATPGPWTAHDDGNNAWVSTPLARGHCIVQVTPEMAAFIAAARTDLPAALDMIDRIEAEAYGDEALATRQAQRIYTAEQALAAAEQEIARLRALVPQVRDACDDLWIGALPRANGETAPDCAPLRKALAALLASAVRVERLSPGARAEAAVEARGGLAAVDADEGSRVLAGVTWPASEYAKRVEAAMDAEAERADAAQRRGVR